MGSRKQPVWSHPHSGHLTFPNKLSQGYMSAPLRHQRHSAENSSQHSFPNHNCLYKVAASFDATRKIH